MDQRRLHYGPPRPPLSSTTVPRWNWRPNTAYDGVLAPIPRPFPRPFSSFRLTTSLPSPAATPATQSPLAPTPVTFTINAHYLGLLTRLPVDQPLPSFPLVINPDSHKAEAPLGDATLEPIDDDDDDGHRSFPPSTAVELSPPEHKTQDVMLATAPAPLLISPQYVENIAEEGPPAVAYNPCPPTLATPSQQSNVPHQTDAPSSPVTAPEGDAAPANAPDADDFSDVERFLDLGPCDAPALPWSIAGGAVTPSSSAVAPQVDDSPPASPDPQPDSSPAPLQHAQQVCLSDLPPADLPSVSPIPSSPPRASSPEPKRVGMRGTFRPPRPVAAVDEQWRVGKPPGWVGLTDGAKRRTTPSDDESHDIAESAARVLKRPFRPPTRVVLPPARHSGKSPTVRLPPEPAPPPSPPRRVNPKRLGTTPRAKPFRVPLRTPSSILTTPIGTPTTPTRPPQRAHSLRKPTDMNHALIASLESRARTLRQAIKYTAGDGDEDARLLALVHTWREAGREVADRLFALLPAPTDEGAEAAPRNGAGPRYHRDNWGFDDTPASTLPALTASQLRYLRSAPTDAAGEPLDPDGNRIFPDLDADLDVLLRGDLPSDSGSYVVAQYDTPPPQPTPAAWDKGAMLLRLGVDPDLLRWDAEAEDWADVDDE